MKNLKNDNRKYKKYKFIFDLPYNSNGLKRSVYLDEEDKVYKIKSIYNTSRFKKNYTVFIQPYNQTGFLTKIRDSFHQVQADLYIPKRNLIQNFVAKVVTPIPKINNKGNFLDIGCNTGNFISKLPPIWKIFGVEVVKEAVDISKRYNNIKVYHSTLENFKTRMRFDFVRASHVIEHIDDYDAFFKKMFKIMNKNSYALLYTPNSGSLSHLLFRKYWDGYYEKTHVSVFNIDNMTKIAIRNGFKVIDKGTYYMGVTAGSIFNLLHMDYKNRSHLIFYLVLFILIYPASFFVNKFNLGGAFYIYLKKNNKFIIKN